MAADVAMAVCYRCLEDFELHVDGKLGTWNDEGTEFTAMTIEDLWTKPNGKSRTTNEVERIEYGGKMSFFCHACLPNKGDLRRDCEVVYG